MTGRLRCAFPAWAGSLLLVPGPTEQGWVPGVILAASWMLLLASNVVESPRGRTLCAALAGAALVVLWVFAPPAYPSIAIIFASSIAWAAAIGPAPRFSRRTLAIALAPALLPAVLSALAWFAGGDLTRQILRTEWQLPSLSFASFATLGRIQAALAVAWLFFGVMFDGRECSGPRRVYASKVILAGGAAVLLAASAARARVIFSIGRLPEDAGWSEPPLLLNLLKLRVGAPIYGPFEDCGSYSYAPILELVHHALLSQFHLDLSLAANRVLVVVWQGCTAAVLAIAVSRFLVRCSAPLSERFVMHAIVWCSMSLVAMSSFLAANLHPDHLLMPCFALALALALHMHRLPAGVVTLGLVLLPPIATSIKLTGAGVGLGLAVACCSSLSKRNILAVGLGAVLSVAALIVLERSMPMFWRYTFELQSSHPIAWRTLWNVPSEPPGRLTLVSLVALGASFVIAPRADAARKEAGRVLLVTLGLALPSLVAYAKVGGRANSLLPLTIGSAVALTRLAAELVPLRAGRRARAAAVSAFLVWGTLTVTPTGEPVTTQVHDGIVRRHELAVALIRREVESGRRTLFYEGTASWIDAGQRSIPRDRWQSVSELNLGRHGEVEAHFARLASGAYDSVLVSERVLVDDVLGIRLRAILDRQYAVLDEPSEGALAPIRVYRRLSGVDKAEARP